MAKTKLDQLLTPGGRLIMGDLMVKGDKDMKGAPTPPEKQAYFFAVAVTKGTPGLNELIGSLYQMAVADYAAVPLVMAQIQQGLNAPNFAWKIQDGDTPTYDTKTGQLRQTPEYMKNTMIFKFRTMFEIGACNEQGIDIARSDIKRGDYVDVMFNASINDLVDDQAGLYLNPVAIRRLGYGDAITGQVAASTAFAGKAAVAPPGATAMPQARTMMPGSVAPPAAAMPGAIPTGLPPAPVAPPIPKAFPPDGWLAHPQAPGYYYSGNEVLTEADLRARFAAPLPVAPVPPVTGHAAGTGMPGMPGATGIASPSNIPAYPAILTGPTGMPGVR